MGKQKPPKSAGELTGFPYEDLWEEFREPWEPLYLHGLERELIRRSFGRSRKAKRADLYLTKAEVRRIIEPLGLRPTRSAALADKLYYYAGHYNSPRFHQLDGDPPAHAKERLRRVANAATKLAELMSGVTPAVWRNVTGARWQLGRERQGSPELKWSTLQGQIVDLAKSAGTIAAEFPQFKRGQSEKTLQGRWLRHSAAALEAATGSKIAAKTSDSAGKKYRLEGVEGEIFATYCTRVDKGLAPKTIVMAVREYQQHGVLGRTRKREPSPQRRQRRAKRPGPGPLDRPIPLIAEHPSKSRNPPI